MKKQIKDVKVVMDCIGVRTAARKSVIYVPSVTVTFNDPQIPKTECLIDGLGGRFKKSDFVTCILCHTFFVLVFKQEWAIVSSEGKLLTTMQPTGQIIQTDLDVCEDYFIVREGNMWVGYNSDASIVGSREMEEEEIAEFDKMQ